MSTFIHYPFPDHEHLNLWCEHAKKWCLGLNSRRLMHYLGDIDQLQPREELNEDVPVMGYFPINFDRHLDGVSFGSVLLAPLNTPPHSTLLDDFRDLIIDLNQRFQRNVGIVTTTDLNRDHEFRWVLLGALAIGYMGIPADQISH